jgi:hypothetical protein
MKLKAFLLTSSALFGLVAVAHLTRLVFHWQIAIGDSVVPYWASVPGLIVSGALAAWGLYLSASSPGR